MDIRQIIINVISTLNQVNVNGKANLDRLLSSIVALENAYKELARKEEDK